MLAALHDNDVLQCGPVSLVVPFVLWSAVGVVAAFVSVAFLMRYSKQP